MPPGRHFCTVTASGLAPGTLRRFGRDLALLLVFLSAATALLVLTPRLSALWATLGWLIWLVSLTAYLHRFWTWLVGPVFFYDLLCSTRRARCFALRVGYALFLLGVLLLVYLQWFGTGRDSFLQVLTGQRVEVKLLPVFSSSFFCTFMFVQLALVVLLTPFTAAAAIAEEKERQTFDHLLVTELHDHELVYGKLASRLTGLGLLVLTGLPLLSFLQFLGGIDPNLVLAGFAATLVTMLSVGSLSLVNSARSQTVRGAVFATYLQMAAYLVPTSCCIDLAWPSTNPLILFGMGNPLVILARVMGAAANALAFERALVGILAWYVLFHLLATVVCCRIATHNLRNWNSEPRAFSERLLVPVLPPPPLHFPSLPHRHVLPGRPRPAVGDRPLLWKEVHVESGLGLGRFQRVLTPISTLLLIFWAVCLTVSASLFLLAASPASAGISRFSNALIRVSVTPLLWGSLIGIAMRASGSLAGERQRQTLDSLLATPVDDRAILFAKWLAALRCVCSVFWVIAPIWLVGLATGGLDGLGLACVIIAWFVYADVAANLGLWFSLVSRTTLRATVETLLSLLVLSGAPYILWSCFQVLARMIWQANLSWARGIDPTSWMLPVSLAKLACSTEEIQSLGAAHLFKLFIGVAGYLIFASALRWLIRIRFGPVTGRMPAGQASR